MKTKTLLLKHGLVMSIVWLLSSCASDIRTKIIRKEGITELSEQKGRDLLERTWKTHGMNHLATHKVYAYEGHDTWKGFMGGIGKVWPDKQSNLTMEHAVGTFDARVKFLDGERSGEISGLQSWNYYEVDTIGNRKWMAPNPRVKFGLAAYQYFFEMLDRLKSAPIVSYAGTREFRDQSYDLVFATWHQPEAHMAHDQYLLWINKETGLLDAAVFTLRENYLNMPGGRMFYGSIEYGEFKSIEGIQVPHEHIVYMFKPNKKKHKHLHKMEIKEFAFDSFDKELLYPNADLEQVGDSKAVGRTKDLLSNKN